MAHPRSPVEVEKTMAKAQKSLDKQANLKGRGRSEVEDIPKKTLSTKMEEGRLSTVLPMVQETGESSSERSIKDEERTSQAKVVDSGATREAEAETSAYDDRLPQPQQAQDQDPHARSTFLSDESHTPYHRDQSTERDGPRDISYVVKDDTDGRAIAHIQAPMSHANADGGTNTMEESEVSRSIGSATSAVGAKFFEHEIGIAR